GGGGGPGARGRARPNAETRTRERADPHPRPPARPAEASELPRRDATAQGYAAQGHARGAQAAGYPHGARRTAGGGPPGRGVAAARREPQGARPDAALAGPCTAQGQARRAEATRRAAPGAGPRAGPPQAEG